MTTKMQFPMFKPETEWTPPSELPDLTGAKEIAIDLETRDPHLKERAPDGLRLTVRLSVTP